MIKRALGLILGAEEDEEATLDFALPEGRGSGKDKAKDKHWKEDNWEQEDEDEEDSDVEFKNLVPEIEANFDPEIQRKLESRLLPGFLATTRIPKTAEEANPVEEEEDEEEEEEDQDEDEVKEGEDSEGSDFDNEPAVPYDKTPTFRGNFKCKLCPDKVLLNDKLLAAHLKSASHKRNENAYKRVQEIGTDAYIAECRKKAEKLQEAKAKADERKASEAADKHAAKVARQEAGEYSEESEDDGNADIRTNRQRCKAKYWEKKNKHVSTGRAANREAFKAAQVTDRERKKDIGVQEWSKTLSPAQIEKAKKKFAEKKARRMARKESTAGAAALPSEAELKTMSKKDKQKAAVLRDIATMKRSTWKTAKEEKTAEYAAKKQKLEEKPAAPEKEKREKKEKKQKK